MKARISFAFFTLLGFASMAGAVDQPYMQSARADLQTAKRELQKATPDKGGHRAKAIGLISDAIAEVNEGIEYARRHNHVVSGDLKTILAKAPDQPHMQAALTALESARNNLDKATPDKGGHRAKAIDLVKSAIDEVKLGIEAGRG
jgi:hypothetical protein